MFVFVPQPPPSPEAVALGHRIAEAVRLLREEDPAIGAQDVRVGLRLAESELRSEFGGIDPHRIAVVVGALLLVLGVGVFVAMSGRLGDQAPVLLAIAGVAVVAMLLIALKRG